MRRLTLHIKGKVQGVGFRFFSQGVANELGLLGSVENKENGYVEIVVEGDETVLKKFLEHIKEGNEYAQVEQLVETWSEGTGKFKDFTVL